MKPKLLVTYASKHGSTAEIAKFTGEVLKKADIETDVLPVANTKSLKQYSGIILGSAVYVGQWRKEAVKFLKNNKQDLKTKSVWLFSTGPTGEGDPVELLKGWKYPDSLKSLIEEINPEEIAVFHGDLDESRLNWLEKKAIKMVKAPTGDFRDWKTIEKWGNHIASRTSGKTADS